MWAGGYGKKNDRRGKGGGGKKIKVLKWGESVERRGK
jgi:hypothetical protein